MNRMFNVLGAVALVALIAAPAFADDPLMNSGARPVNTNTIQNSIVVNPSTGEVTVSPYSGGGERTQKHISYQAMNYAFSYYPAGVGYAVADDLRLDKIPGKDLMNKYSFIYYIYPVAAPNGSTIKIDWYDLVHPVYGAILPSNASLIPHLSNLIFDVPAGLNIVTIDLDPALPKEDEMWATIQDIGNGEFGLLILAHNGGATATVGYTQDLFAQNTDKTNDLGWGTFYFGGPASGLHGSFAWEVWNSPEPATLTLLAGAGLALIRRRR
jgi:hypothetical protein